MKLLKKETTKFIILLIIIFIEIFVIIYNDHNCKGMPQSSICAQAFNCKVDEKNPNISNCDYLDENGTTKKTQCRFEE